VLAPDVRFEGFTHQDWTRFLELFEPVRPEGKPRDPDRPQGLVVALHGDGKLLKLLHSKAGRLRLDDVAPDWPVSAAELARRHDASWALKLEATALDNVMENLGLRLRRQDDHTTQWLLFLSALQEESERGGIELWPSRLSGIPVPTKAMIDTTLDQVCPPGQTMLIGLFDRESLWTAIALRRGFEGFDHILGPDEMRDHLGLLSGDFRRDHRHLARAVSDRLGPLSLGCFAEYETFRKLEVDPTPGAWAMAVAVRDVVLAPVPPAMAVPLGLDAGRAAFSAMREVALRFGVDTSVVLAPAFSAIRDVTLGDRELEDVLGFNPLSLLRQLLSRDR
jgi:hypothetical protein